MNYIHLPVAEDKERSLVKKDAIANVDEQRMSKQLTIVNAAADSWLSSFDSAQCIQDCPLTHCCV